MTKQKYETNADSKHNQTKKIQTKGVVRDVLLHVENKLKKKKAKILKIVCFAQSVDYKRPKSTDTHIHMKFKL